MASLEESNTNISVFTEKCKLCLTEQARYTCPRCNVTYCSIACYKCQAHADCSEGFYKDCFMQGLQDMKSPADKGKVIDMLKRVSEEKEPLDSDDEDSDSEDLADRLQGLDLDTDTRQVWDQLTDKEKSQFREMVADGRLGQLVAIWAPWWITQEEPLVQEVTDAEETDVTIDRAPPILPHFPDIDVLLKNKAPSEVIQYNLINIIYGYAYITRLYNGDLKDICQQVTQELMSLSLALGQQTYSSAQEAVQGCIHCMANQAQSLFVSTGFSTGIMEDACHIIQGPGPGDPLQFVLAALSDLHRLYSHSSDLYSKACRGAKKPTAETSDDSTVLPPTARSLKQKCRSVVKKLEFLLAWTTKYGCRLQDSLPELQLLFCEMSSRMADHNHTKDKLEQLKKQNLAEKPLKKFIEEV